MLLLRRLIIRVKGRFFIFDIYAVSTSIYLIYKELTRISEIQVPQQKGNLCKRLQKSVLSVCIIGKPDALQWALYCSSALKVPTWACS